MEQTLPKMLKNVAETYPEIFAQYTRTKSGEFEGVNYHDMFQRILDFAGGLLDYGIKRGERIGLISDNRKEWQYADMGLLAIGCVDTPRGCDATESDLSYILSFAECRFVITENTTQVKKLLNIKKNVPTLETICAFDPVDPIEQNRAKELGVTFLQFYDVLKKGREWRKIHPDGVESELEKGQWDDLATIIFTSGTTGTPKGVMLSHGNFLTQLDELVERIYLNPGEKCLCVLPIWHVFQREFEYLVLCQAAGLVYSKPIGSVLLADFQKMNPHLMPCVPRVWSALYDGIWKKIRKEGGFRLRMFEFFVFVCELWDTMDRKLRRKKARFGKDYVGLWWCLLFIPWIALFPLKLLGYWLAFAPVRKMFGKNFRVGIAGGGAYPEYLDKFFWAAGVNIVDGYGLTETAPVVAVRPAADPVMRTIGTALRGVEVRVVDDNGVDVGQCKKGILQVRGGTVMKGYYRRDDLTAKVMTKDGWFDTGDLAILTVDNEIQLRGRKKDTIVLQGGENIEPVPIEQKLNTSRYISTAVVFGANEKGEDQRFLAALILLRKDEIEAYAVSSGISEPDYEKLAQRPEIRNLISGEIAELVNAKNGFKSFEKINEFEVITKPFTVGVELSAKQELMRYKIAEIYKAQIAKMFSSDK